MRNRIQKISKYRPSELQSTIHFEVLRPRAGLAVEHPYESVVRSILFGVLALLVCAYLYFVAASILNVMARKDAIASASQITGSISAMEQQYFSLSEEVTPVAGQALGLVPLKQTAYVRRPGNAAVAGTITKVNEI